MNFRPFLLSILCSSALLTKAQTTTDNPLLSHIPADADKVYHVNYNVLAGKLDWKALGPTLFKKEEDRKYTAYLTDPGNEGIDSRYGVFIAQSNVLHPDSARYTTVLFALTDSAKLIQFIKADNHPETEGKLSFHAGNPRTGVQGKTAFAYNDKFFAITFVKAPASATGMPPNQQKNPGADPAVVAKLQKYILSATRRAAAAIKGFAKSPAASDPDFRAAIADDADGHIYSRYGSGFGMIADAMRMTHAPVGSDIVATMDKMKHSHMHTIGTIRFEKGRMSLRSRLIYDSLAGVDLGLRPINPALVERLPQGNLLGLLALHIDPAIYLDFFQKAAGNKANHSIDSMLAKKNWVAKEIVSAFKGDLLIAAIDNGKPVPATDSTPAKPGKPTFYGVVTIANKALFEKMDTQLHPDSAKPKKGFAHTLRDDLLVIGPDKQATEDFFNKPGRGPSRLLSEETRNSALVFAIDIKALATYLAPMFASGSPKDQQAKVVIDLFDQLSFSADVARGNAIESLFEIKMADKEQNSLTIISQLLAMAGKH